MSDLLVIFAREPIAGRVKTRLAAGIGANAATEVYRKLLEHTIETARSTGIHAVVFLADVPGEAWASTLGACKGLMVDGFRVAAKFPLRRILGAVLRVRAGNPTKRAFTASERRRQSIPYRLLDHSFEIQVKGDLGRRMGECFSRSFADGASRVVLVGSDNAHFRKDHIRGAFDALDDHRVVLGPADDGGYWLVGQRMPGIDFFRGIPWSDPATLETTRERLRELHVAWSELETLPDIDTAEDLRRAIDDLRVDEGLRRQLQTIAGTL